MLIQTGNGRIDRFPGRDHHHDAAWLFQGGQELVQAGAGDQVLARIFRAEGFHLFGIQVIAGHTETVPFHVEGQHVTHDAQSHHSKIRFFHIISPNEIL